MKSGPESTQIQNLFASIAHGYDQANDWMTWGMAHRWRSQLVNWSEPPLNAHVLDCATGTGDLALAFHEKIQNSGHVTGVDFCKEMLEVARKKSPTSDHLHFVWADVLNLPFENHRFDVCSIAYGLRNVENRELALCEMARVLKPGGTLMILETGDVEHPLLSRLMKFYFKQAVPRIGGWLTGQPSAYEYLNQSSQAFPSGPSLVEWMMDLGFFASVQYRSLMGGASFLYKSITLDNIDK